MSRSNHDKPFYVDVGTSIVAVRCASNHDVVIEHDHARWKWAIEEAERVCDRLNKEAEIGNPPRSCDSGNAVEMYEALSEVLSMLRNVIGAEEDDAKLINDCKRRIRAALSKPPRQCDVGTVAEQAKRFGEFCSQKGEGFMSSAHCAYECPCGNKGDCKLAWAQMPYADERKGEGDGSK